MVFMYCLLFINTQTHTMQCKHRKLLPPNPVASFLNAALFSIYDSVSVAVAMVLVSTKPSVTQINFLFRLVEVEARAEVGARVGVAE